MTITISNALAQTKLLDYELFDSTHSMNQSIIYKFQLYSILSDYQNTEDCKGKLIDYNMQSGLINKRYSLYSKYNDTCFSPIKLSEDNGNLYIISQFGMFPNDIKNRFSILEINNKDTIVYNEKKKIVSYKVDTPLMTEISNNELFFQYPNYSGEDSSANYKTYKLSIKNDSLENELIIEHTVNSKDYKFPLLIENSKYVASIVCEKKIISNHESDDLTMKLHIMRYDRVATTVDSIILDFDKNYERFKVFSYNNEVYLFAKFVSSSPNEIYKLSIFKIDLEKLRISKLNEIEFPHSFTINNIKYDKFINQIILYGFTTVLFDTYLKSNWIASLDENFNITGEINWNQTVDKDEFIKDLNIAEDGYIIYSEDVIASNNSIPFPNYHLYKIKRDFLTSIDDKETNEYMTRSNEGNIIFRYKDIPYNIEIFDITGKKVGSVYNINVFEYNYNIQNLNKGIYLIRLGNITMKIFKFDFQ